MSAILPESGTKAACAVAFTSISFYYAESGRKIYKRRNLPLSVLNIHLYMIAGNKFSA